MVEGIKRFKAKHQGLFEFILFNILSNIATITNFVVLNLSALFLVSLADRSFSFWVFEYPPEAGGLAGFISFLLSYAAAQTVNFVVQRKLVFNANNKLGGAIPLYLAAVVGVYFICLYVPSLVSPFLNSLVGITWARNLANVLNIFIQVVILFPVLKFVVMRKVISGEGAGSASGKGEGTDP